MIDVYIKVVYKPILSKFGGNLCMVVEKDSIWCSNKRLALDVFTHLKSIQSCHEKWLYFRNLTFALHEPWHILQRRRMGWLYYIVYVLFSIIPWKWRPQELKPIMEEKDIHQTPAETFLEFLDSGMRIQEVVFLDASNKK